MKAFRQLALESQLEIEKLHEATRASYSKSEARVLYDNLKTEKQTQALADQPPQDATGQAKTVDSEQPSDDPAGSPEGQSDSESEELTPAVEELRRLSYATEDFSESFSAASSQSSSIKQHLLDAGRSIASLGIEYGPQVASRLYKGVTYVFGKLTRLLVASTHTLSKYVERRVRSFENLKASIRDYRKALELIEGDVTEDSLHQHKLVYSNVKVINTLKIADSVDFTANIKTLTDFVKKTVHDINVQVLRDIQIVHHMIAMSESGAVNIPASLTAVRPAVQGMVQGSVQGYESNSEHTQSYKYNETLPSDVVLMAQLPSNDFKSVDDIAKAYSHSNMGLGFDGGSFKEVLSVDYMTARDLAGFLDSLEELVDACIAHQSLYEKIIVSKKSMRFTLKGYFKFLAFSTDKVSLKNSLIEHVYLKSMFVDKVYLVAAMDIHDYSARVVSYGLSFAKDNVKKLG